MLEIQKLLKETHGPTLVDVLGISVNKHSTLPIAIYNYCQIESDKHNPVTQEARGLVLDNDYQIVAKSFNRFFNLGEMPELHTNFNWKSFTCQSKEDGSLILIYKYNGEIVVQTRNSYGDGQVNGSQFTWRQLVEQALGNLRLEALFDNLTEVPQTYIFELVSPYNQIVRAYSKPDLYLLSAFSDEFEWTHEQCDDLAAFYGFNRPQLFNFQSLDEIQSYLKQQEQDDPTFEGVICRDSNNMRLKIKSASYLRLHRSVNNGNIFLPKNLVPVILNKEIDEIICYYESMRPEVDKVRAILNTEFSNLMTIWEQVKDIKEQKTFAINVIDKSKFSSILFTARKMNVCPSKIWKESSDLLVKVLFK